MANPQDALSLYSLVDLECQDQDPEVEKFLRVIFPRNVQDFDPEVCDVPG